MVNLAIIPGFIVCAQYVEDQAVLFPANNIIFTP
jgi:hypothetical protein